MLPALVRESSREFTIPIPIHFLKGTVVMPRYTLETIIVILLILWLLGAFVAPVGGNLIHILLVIVLVVVVVRLVQGRSVL